MTLSIADLFKNHVGDLKKRLPMHTLDSLDWLNPQALQNILPVFISAMNELMTDYHAQQTPFILQPIWKTYGKQLVLHENAFDVFVWSNFATTQLFFYVMKNISKQITRQTRAIIWLMRMLFDFVRYGQIDYGRVIDELSFSTKNDKAFSVSGRITQTLMACP